MKTLFDPRRRRFLRQLLRGSLLTAGFNPHARANTAAAAAPVLIWGKRGSAAGEFIGPIALAFNPQDELHVADALNQRVQVFTTDGALARMFPMQVRPAGVAVDHGGLVYVSNWNRHQIAVHSPAGERVREWGRMGTAPGEFRLPGGLAFGPDGSLYVADQGNSRIQQFTPMGVFLRAWGTRGGGPGQFGAGQDLGTRFAGPQFVAVDGRGRVYATDTASFRVQRFSASGHFEVQWRNDSAGPGGFGPVKPPPSGPIAVGIDRQGRVWVTAVNNRVQQFTAEGRFLRALGTTEPDDAPGRFHIPHGIACDSQGFLYVADTLNFRIQKFSIADRSRP
jgi:sugar lactone lactonase YvrE